jgi:hypothetical protein
VSQNTLRVARRLMAALNTLAGARATGTATVRSTSGTPTLKRGAVCVPLPGGQIDYQRPLFVTADTPLTTGGVAVPLKSLVGGPQHNGFAPGTVLRWFPQEPDVEATSVVLAQPTGGTAGVVRRVVFYEQLGADAAKDLFAASVGEFPALVLSWDRSVRYETKGKGKTLRRNQWLLFVVVSRSDAYERRGADGLEILDTAEELLMERSQIDGLVVSGPPIEIAGRGRLSVSPQSFVYTLTFSTFNAAVRDDSALLAASTPWHTTTEEGQSEDKPVVIDLKMDMIP